MTVRETLIPMQALLEGASEEDLQRWESEHERDMEQCPSGNDSSESEEPDPEIKGCEGPLRFQGIAQWSLLGAGAIMTWSSRCATSATDLERP